MFVLVAVAAVGAVALGLPPALVNYGFANGAEVRTCHVVVLSSFAVASLIAFGLVGAPFMFEFLFYELRYLGFVVIAVCSGASPGS